MDSRKRYLLCPDARGRLPRGVRGFLHSEALARNRAVKGGSMTQEQRARALGITVRHLRKLEARGCPSDLAGARAWRAQYVLPRARSRSDDSEYELTSVIAAMEA